MPIDWNAIYEEELAKIEDPTTGINALKDADVKALDTAKATQESTLGKTRDESLRQSYITREMNKRDLPSIMSNMGLTGGITETAAGDLLRDYRNTSNSARKGYNTGVTDIANTYNTNVAGLNSTYGQRILDALANRNTTATTNANIRAQIAQAEEAAALARDQWDWQKAQTETTATPAATIAAPPPSPPPAKTARTPGSDPIGHGDTFTSPGKSWYDEWYGR